MHSFFCDMIGDAGSHPFLDARERDHLFKTLRTRPGDEIRLLDGRGTVARARVLAGREIEVMERQEFPPPARRLLLGCAVPRRAKFDLLLKQAAELGVSKILPVICERSVAQPEGSERWTTLLQEGCKQSGNPFLPEIGAPLPLKAALEELHAENVAIFFGAVPQQEQEQEEAATVPGAGEKPGALCPAAAAALAWLVGPEGGFSAVEETLLLKAGARGINLGPYILRLETAAVCGLAVLRQRMMTEEAEA